MNNDTSFERLPDGLTRFIHNMNQKKPFSNLHNVYVIKLTSTDGDERTYYGSNVMTDYFFKSSYGYGGGYAVSPNRIIYLGDGVDQDHQPSCENSAMFNPLPTPSSYSNLFDKYPLQFDSTTNDLTTLIKVAKATFNYNLSGVNVDRTCNEIGCGSSANQLFSHSKIYDENGDEKTIVKRINEKLYVELFWTISMNKSVYESMWSNGIYGAFDPILLLQARLNSNQSTTGLSIMLQRSGSTLVISNRGAYDSMWPGYYVSNNIAPYAVGSVKGTVDLVTIPGSSKWTTRTNELSYVMEKNIRDFFTGFEIYGGDEYPGSDRTNAYVYTIYYGMIYFYKQYKMSTPEEIEMYIRTDHFNDSKFYEVLGINTQRTAPRYAGDGISNYNYKRLWGHVPVTDLNIKSLYRYNFSTDAWDIPVSYNNPSALPDDAYDISHEYDRQTWFGAAKIKTECPDHVVREMLVYSNAQCDQHKIKGFKGLATYNYATNTWWDVSTWEVISDFENLPVNLQQKKYYICDNFFGTGQYVSTTGSEYSIGAATTSSFRWPVPDIEYTNGVHGLQNISDPVIFDDFYSKPSSWTDTMISNETCDFYVRSNVLIKKVSENKQVNINTCFQNKIQSEISGSSDVKFNTFIYMKNGKALAFLSCYTQSGQYVYIRDLKFCITDLSQNADDINENTTDYVTITSFSVSISNKSDAGVLTVGNDYLIMIPTTTVTDNDVSGYECVIYDTNTMSEFKIPGLVGASTSSVTEVRGNVSHNGSSGNELLIAPGGSFEHFTFYDVENHSVVETFDISSDYVFETMFAFDDYAYIRCAYGNEHVMLLYNRTDGTITSITYPDILNTLSFTFGYHKKDNTSNADGYNISTASAAINTACQYNEGIVIMTQPYSDYHFSDRNRFNNPPLLIFSKYDPSNIIAQKFSKDYTNDNIWENTPDSHYVKGMFTGSNVAGMSLKKMYGSYYGFIHGFIEGGNNTVILDIGRIVRNGESIPWTFGDLESVNEKGELSRCDLLAIKRNGQPCTGGSYYKFTPWVTQSETCIFAVTDEMLNHTYKLAFDNFITYKIRFKTYTCTRWNNPKRITYPTYSFTVTNHV